MPLPPLLSWVALQSSLNDRPVLSIQLTDPEAPVWGVAVIRPDGSASDPVGQEGFMHLAEHLRYIETGIDPGQEAVIGAWTDQDWSVHWARFLKGNSDAEETRLLPHPVSPEAVEIEAKIIEIEAPLRSSYNSWIWPFFHLYSRPILGTPESRAAIPVEAIIDYINSPAPAFSVMVRSGGSSAPRNYPPITWTPPLLELPTYFYNAMPLFPEGPILLTDTTIGWMGPRALHPDTPAMMVVEQLLKNRGLLARLWSGRAGGVTQIYGKPRRIKRVLMDLQRHISEADLEAAKHGAWRKLAWSLDGSARRSISVGLCAGLTGDPGCLLRFWERIEQLKPDDLQAALICWLPLSKKQAINACRFSSPGSEATFPSIPGIQDQGQYPTASPLLQTALPDGTPLWLQKLPEHPRSHLELSLLVPEDQRWFTVEELELELGILPGASLEVGCGSWRCWIDLDTLTEDFSANASLLARRLSHSRASSAPRQLVVAGGRAEAADLQNFQPRSRPLPKPIPAEPIVDPDNLTLSWAGPCPDAPDYLAWLLAMESFGGHDHTPLETRLRRELGLVYSLALTEARHPTGCSLGITTRTTSPEQVKREILQLSKNFLPSSTQTDIAYTALQIHHAPDSLENRVWSLGRELLWHLPPNSLLTPRPTLKAIQAATQHYLHIPPLP
jgi:hypothetical protein